MSFIDKKRIYLSCTIAFAELFSLFIVAFKFHPIIVLVNFDCCHFDVWENVFAFFLQCAIFVCHIFTGSKSQFYQFIFKFSAVVILFFICSYSNSGISRF